MPTSPREAPDRLIADTSPVMAWVTDAQGRVEFVNHAYCEFFGITEADVRELDWQLLVHPDDVEEYVREFRNCLRAATPFFAEANAAKYTPRAGRIRLLVEGDAAWATIRVHDTGIGVSPSDLSEIFNVFVRASGRSEEGFRIGLAVARRLVEAHGGSIEALSGGPGQGSDFVVRLPISLRSDAV